MGGACRWFVAPFVVAYVGWFVHELHAIFRPPNCAGPHCIKPLLEEGGLIDLVAYLDGEQVWNASGVSSSETLKSTFKLPIPAAVRRGERDSVRLQVFLSLAGVAQPVAAAHVEMVRMMPPPHRTESMLLASESDGGRGHALLPPHNHLGHVPHYAYASAPLLLRLVTDTRAHAQPNYPDGVPIGAPIDWSRRRYSPAFYADEFALLPRHAVVLSGDVGKAHPTVRLELRPTSVGRYRLMTQLGTALKQLGEIVRLEDEIDELRDLLSEDRIYRFLLMQLIGLLHIVFDVLAFKNDMGFWKGREDMQGLSSNSVLFNAGCTVVIYLYLLDAPSINSIVLASYTVSTVLELFKVARVLRIRRALLSAASSSRGAALTTGQQTALATDRFDAIATRTLTVGLSPLVVGWAAYALIEYPHRSWYSWVVSSLADAIYLFGFIAMTPQLFINYKLKSVAHLPWRVLAYKAFNTFVDDAFALMVSMPTAHRIACLRDDVIFVIFLYQLYLYPVDKTRANEYGIAYERAADARGGAARDASDASDATDAEPLGAAARDGGGSHSLPPMEGSEQGESREELRGGRDGSPIVSGARSGEEGGEE